MKTDEIISTIFLSPIFLSCITLLYFVIRRAIKVNWKRTYQKATFKERRKEISVALKGIDKKKAATILIAVGIAGLVIPILLNRMRKRK